MPFFEMLPGGMPAGLQSDMNAVLNKKFGTVLQDYSPETWPDTVNLMGPLEEKTVSGSVVAFFDGADDVPLKSCAVTIAPTLVGVSSVGVVQTGKNLVNIPDSAEITRNQLIANVVPLLDDFLNGKKGNYTISAKTAETVENANFITIRINYTDGTSSSNVYIYRGSTHESGGITGTFSISSDPTKTIESVSFGGNTGTAKCAVSEWQIEANAQATAYAPYVTPITHTATLGRTIYGGSVDVVKGQGESTHANVKVSDLTWTKQTASGRDFFISQVSNMKTGTPKEIASVLPYGGEITVAAMADKSLASWTNSLRIYDTDITTVSELLEAYGNDGISYPLATPETFTFTPVPIDSRLGDNTIWSDGDLEVVYRSMGTVYQYTEGEEVYF